MDAMTATAAMGFLIVVLLVAATSPLWVAVATSFAAVLAFNFFFLPPVGTLTIADPQNWTALFALLVVSLVASNLSAVARARTREAEARRDELGAAVRPEPGHPAHHRERGGQRVARRLHRAPVRFDYVAICMPHGAEWLRVRGRLTSADARTARAVGRCFAASKTDSRRRRARRRCASCRCGSAPGRSACSAWRAGRSRAQTLDAVAGLAAIAIERAQFLDDRKAADLARQGEALKSALLASLGHDLRTPLTAIRVAASNLQASWPDERERREQSDLILTEVDRLTRLFQNILEMARIDAGAITEDMRWVVAVGNHRGGAQPRRARAARAGDCDVRPTPIASSGSIRA